ncbi:MAG: hypothetical protein EON93_26335 [Burkholderiales bacterium]|nr:MAG: hypothetical protein EON93_26335 [Burkholderiales bacterium]
MRALSGARVTLADARRRYRQIKTSRGACRLPKISAIVDGSADDGGASKEASPIREDCKVFEKKSAGGSAEIVEQDEKSGIYCEALLKTKFEASRSKASLLTDSKLENCSNH